MMEAIQGINRHAHEGKKEGLCHGYIHHVGRALHVPPSARVPMVRARGGLNASIRTHRDNDADVVGYEPMMLREAACKRRTLVDECVAGRGGSPIRLDAQGV